MILSYRATMQILILYMVLVSFFKLEGKCEARNFFNEIRLSQEVIGESVLNAKEIKTQN